MGFNINTKTRELDLPHLGKVKVTELSVQDVLASGKLSEQEQILFLVERSLVQPKVTDSELKALPVSCLEDLATIVEAATGQNTEK